MKTKTSSTGGPPKPPKKTGRGLGDGSPESRRIEIPDPISVKDLAQALGGKTFRIISDLIALRVFVQNDQGSIGFDIAAQIARQHGFVARRAP